MELTEEQARQELSNLSESDLIELAEKEGKPTAGKSKEELIDLLLGKCHGCKKGVITVIIISSKTKKSFIQNQTSAPCLGCGK